MLCSPRLAATAWLALLMLVTMGLGPDGAQAWTRTRVVGAAAHLDVLRSGRMRVVLKTRLKVTGGSKPFQFVGIAGGILFVLGFIGGGIYLLVRFGFDYYPGLRIQAILLLAMVLGLQLAVLGLLGEFIVRIFHLTQGQPFYVVREEEGSKDKSGETHGA